VSGYRLDPAAFREELLNADWMVALMREHAERGRAWAQENAPVSTEPDDDHPGRYKASFSVESRKHGGVHGDRAEAVLSSDDPAALSIEFGHQSRSGNHVEGHHTLTRAMDVMR
jgi:hypothetical protein